MAYKPTKWEDLPSEKTPLNAANLNKLENGIKQIHDMADNTDGLVGASPMMDGKNRVGINGYRITVTGDNEIILAVSDTGSFSAGIRIDKDNNAHAHNKVWDQDTLIVNHKKLMDEIKKLEDRIALLESK